MADTPPTAAAAPLPRIVIAHTAVQGGLLIVVGSTLPSVVAAGLTILIEQPCELQVLGARVGD